ncbi:glycosyltransferase family 4 protein [Pistricoccus aurantiacus]|uniref:glycosyltransferase family 4 protein n=1 Tax=Pistricoccus aurantiacus TaxID=1883414 RepID=UPI00363F4321
MRVIYFHQHFSTPQGAAGTRSYEFARRLVKQGHHVTMVCGSYGKGNTGLVGPFKHGKRIGVVQGINIIELDISYSNDNNFFKRTFLFLMFALRSIKLVFTQEYDLLFATSTPLTAGIPGIVGRWLRGKPFVFEVRDLWPELPKEMGVITNPFVLAAMSLLEWASYKSAHRLIGLSPGIVKGIVRKGVSKDKVALIPNGCDLDLFSFTGRSSESPVACKEPGRWRPENVSQDDFMAVFTGTHGIANGLNSVLDAARLLKERNRNDIRIVLIGQGKLKPELQAKAHRQQLNNVVFHDSVSKERLSGLMASADLGLQILANVPAFYYGTSPNKFFDYIAAGLPVLNNYPGWLADTIREYDCGFVVPPDDPVAFADALEAAADDTPSLERMSRNAQALASEKFDRNKLSASFVSWLEATWKEQVSWSN